MWRLNGLTLTLIASLVVGAIAPLAQAVRLADGTVHFVSPPRLDGASTTRSVEFVRGATYYFTLQIPDNAGEPLGRVLIQQRDGESNARRIAFDAEETIAFIGTRRNRDESVAIAAATYDDATQSVSVTFATPVPAGTTVTVGLKPDRNPRTDGVYLFGVTAYPAGEPAYGQFLGYGRLHFYDRGSVFPVL